MQTRRDLLRRGAAILVAPAIVRASSLMAIHEAKFVGAQFDIVRGVATRYQFFTRTGKVIDLTDPATVGYYVGVFRAKLSP